MLFVIGLGLGDERDITVKGLEAIKKSDKIYLEAYTSILSISRQKLEEYYGKPVLEADRDKVEQEADEILEAAKTQTVSFLVVGDPFGATTHTDLVLRAKKLNIQVEVIHNASIMNAIGCTGLQLYSFGHTVSIPFWTDNWKPDSFYERIKQNKSLGLHTLCLLDIKVKEQSVENLLRGRKIYEPPRFMTVNQCIEQLLEAEENRKEGVCGPDSFAIGVARVGQPTQFMASGTILQLKDLDYGPPLHSFVICGEMHPLEKEYFDYSRTK